MLKDMQNCRKINKYIFLITWVFKRLQQTLSDDGLTLNAIMFTDAIHCNPLKTYEICLNDIRGWNIKIMLLCIIGYTSV